MNLNNLKEKSFFKKVVVVDIPYVPFQRGQETEKRIVDHIANRLIKIIRDEKRLSTFTKNYGSRTEKDRHFVESETLVAIDASSISTNEVTYLNWVQLILNLYPCIIINCNIPVEELTNLALHDRLYSKGYILPIFRRMPAVDMLAATQRYGKSFSDILSGEKSSVNFDSLEIYQNDDELHDLFERFTGLGLDIKQEKQECTIKHFLGNIVWLGAKKDMAQYLTYLFNNNIESFLPNEVPARFHIDNFEFKDFIPNSMLFGKLNKGNKLKIQFRLQKKFLYLNILHGLMSQLDEKMIDAGAIDTSCGKYPGTNVPGEIIEYHSTGKLFDKDTTYSCKLLCYTRQCLRSDIEYDTILIIDNGNEYNLFLLLKKFFVDKKIIRIVNYFKTPLFYPFESIDKSNKVVIIADVINSGHFLNKLCKLINSTGAEIKAIFSFIIGQETKRKGIFANIPNGDRIPLFYYAEKILTNVQKARYPEQINRFFFGNLGQRSKPVIFNKSYRFDFDSFLFFWQTAKFLCDCKCRYIYCDAPPSQFDDFGSVLGCTWCHEIFPQKIDQVEKNCHLALCLKAIIDRNSIECACIVTNDDFDFFNKIISKENREIDIYHIRNEHDLDERIYKHNRILFIFTWINLGYFAKYLLEQVISKAPHPIELTCFSLFTRRNPIPGNYIRSVENFKELEEMNVSFYNYYDSALPYYLFDDHIALNSYIKSSLQKIYQ